MTPPMISPQSWLLIGKGVHQESAVYGRAHMGNQTDTASELTWEGLSARDFYAYLATLRGVSRNEAKRAFLEWYYADAEAEAKKP